MFLNELLLVLADWLIDIFDHRKHTILYMGNVLIYLCGYLIFNLQ